MWNGYSSLHWLVSALKKLFLYNGVYWDHLLLSTCDVIVSKKIKWRRKVTFLWAGLLERNTVLQNASSVRDKLSPRLQMPEHSKESKYEKRVKAGGGGGKASVRPAKYTIK